MMHSGNDIDAKDLHVCERVYAGVGARCACYNEPAILEARCSDIVKLMLQKPEHLLHHLARVGVVGGILQVVGAPSGGMEHCWTRLSNVLVLSAWQILTSVTSTSSTSKHRRLLLCIN